MSHSAPEQVLMVLIVLLGFIVFQGIVNGRTVFCVIWIVTSALLVQMLIILAMCKSDFVTGWLRRG